MQNGLKRLFIEMCHKKCKKYYSNKKEQLVVVFKFIHQKISKLMNIPLFSKVLDILDKRNGEFPRAISD